MPQGVKNRILQDPDSLLRSVDGLYELRTKGSEWQILCEGKPQEYLEYGYDFFRLNFTYEKIKQAMPMYLDEIAEGNGPWPDPEPPIEPKYSPGPWKILHLRLKGEEQISIWSESGVICRIRNEVSRKPLGEDDEWNAMLIAAAPRMYECLRDLALDGYYPKLEAILEEMTRNDPRSNT